MTRWASTCNAASKPPSQTPHIFAYLNFAFVRSKESAMRLRFSPFSLVVSMICFKTARFSGDI